MPRRPYPPSADGRPGPAWSVPSLREPRYSQSLERGLAILSAFTPERPVLGIAEIAGELGMSRSTTHRYVITLVALGYLEQGASRKYRLGLRVTQLGMSALNSTSLHEHALPYLEELRVRYSYSYSSNVGVLDGDEVVLVQRVRGPSRQRRAPVLAIGTGSRLPAHCTSLGKLLLAYLPQSQREQVVSSLTLSRCGPRTITNKRALREELTRIRTDGLATSREEMVPEMQAVAVPVRGEGGEVVAGVNLVVDGARVGLPEVFEQVAAQLIATAARISERLGHRPGASREH